MFDVVTYDVRRACWRLCPEACTRVRDLPFAALLHRRRSLSVCRTCRTATCVTTTDSPQIYNRFSLIFLLLQVNGLVSAFPSFGPPQAALNDSDTAFLTWCGCMSSGTRVVFGTSRVTRHTSLVTHPPSPRSGIMSSGYTGLWTSRDTSSIPDTFGAHGGNIPHTFLHCIFVTSCAGPLVLFKSDGSCIVMSPATSFMTANMVCV